MASKQSLKDQDTLEKVEFPKEGGVLSYLKGRKKPFPGFPHAELVATMGFIKRLIPSLLSGYYSLIKPKLIKPEKYSRPVREIYRIFNLLIERESDEGMKQKWIQMRDIICMILEFDNAYRFRFQDVVSEMNLEEIKPDENAQYYIDIRQDNYNWGGKKSK